MSNIEVVGLFTYPVKSMRGVRHDEVRVTARGFEHDRRFMLVDPAGLSITQRECPEIATYSVWVVQEGGPYLKIRGERWTSPVQMPGVFCWDKGKRIMAIVRGDTVEAVVQGGEVNDILSRSLGRPVRLVYIPESSERLARGQVRDGDRVLNGFADSFPFLLTTAESLAALNEKIGGEPEIGMDRFRPNIVVRGCEAAFDEEYWRSFLIGGVTFYGMKRCNHCTITTIDQKIGVRTGEEPLKVLSARFRWQWSIPNAYFGMKLNHEGTGVIRVGDRVQVIERGCPFIVDKPLQGN